MQALSYKNNNFDITEPFDGLFTQGMVCHETYKDEDNNWLSPDEIFSKDGKEFYTIKKNQKVIVGPSESMSKSKRNTVDPEKMINNYGADAVRLFIMSDSPPEKDVQWSNEGMEGSYKFIQKLWTLHQKIINKINEDEKGINDENISKYTNSLVFKITNNLENFRYNVIVANFYEMYNFFSKEMNNPINKNTLIDNYYIILKLLNPFIPHFTSECFEEFSKFKKVDNTWPLVNEKILENEKVNIVIQINGKKREILSVKKDLTENELLNLVNSNERIKSFMIDKKITKKIFVPNKIINLIVK